MKKTKSRVNEAGNYTKPSMRKALFESIKSGGKGGKPGQWSARKAQMLAQQYKAKGGGGTEIESFPEKSKELDGAEVANQIWQAVHSGAQGNGRALFA